MIRENEIGVTEPSDAAANRRRMKIRDRFAAKVGVSEKRKGEIYLDLARSTTLTDPAYWLQTLFAAGIATLGLALNSPAVIIGAMLISPLMGPILASGLALAVGDVILGVRSALNLTLSCLLAIGFAFLLVTILPFKEITNEIAVRMHPTTLDLAVALFSGAIGSIAICKEVKGVVTSIPGVAIAVALMPPLGVVGYGIAVAYGLNADEGKSVALGGGLLFLTNLVAITSTAMIVFLALHIDAPAVRDQIRQWHKSDTQSIWVRKIFSRLPGVPGARGIGTLPARLLMILVIILVILIPLSRSFNQLKQEFSNQKRENRIRQVVSQTWQKEFGKLANGEARSFLDHVAVTDREGKLSLLIRVLTTKPLTASEKEEFNRELAINLARPPGTLISEVIEVPTASVAMRSRAAEVQTQLPPSVLQLQAAFLKRVGGALSNLYLPPPAQFVDYQLLTSGVNSLQVTIYYLSDRDIDADAQALITQEVRARLDHSNAAVDLERLPVSIGQMVFQPREISFHRASLEALDRAANYLTNHPRLMLRISNPLPVSQPTSENPINETEQRLSGIMEYLNSRWQIAEDRIVMKTGAANENAWALELILSE